MKWNIHIERLTVEGQSHSDGVRVGDALRLRLAELTAAGAPGQPQALNIDRLDAGELPRGAGPVQTGHHLAGRIFQSLSAQKGSPNG